MEMNFISNICIVVILLSVDSYQMRIIQSVSVDYKIRLRWSSERLPGTTVKNYILTYKIRQTANCSDNI